MSAADTATSETDEASDTLDTPGGAVRVDLSDEALDALIERVEHARDHHLALAPEDLSQLLSALTTLAHVNERLEHRDLTIGKLRRLLGIARSSEDTRGLAAAVAGEDGSGGGGKGGDGERTPGSGSGAGSANGKGKGDGRGKSDRRRPSKPRPKPPEIHKHPITGLEKGACCPECGRGRVYKFAPAEFTRVRGNALYTSERHVMEQLRCNACQAVQTAELPAEVLADGARGQSYGYSALALMGIMKYFAGEPFYRSMTIQGLLGVSLSASTIFDQCEKLSTALNPVFRALQRQAAQAMLLYIDDTTHRILDAQPIRKRRGNRERLRSGVYTSALLALVRGPPGPDLGGEGMAASIERSVVLFKTDIGHAGEWLDEILGYRAAGLGAPVVMSDALSSNRSAEHEVVRASCNAHGRRAFFEVAASYPDEALHALELYKGVWVNEAHCRNEGLSPEARLAYHRAHSGPVMEALHAWCTESIEGGAVEANGALGKAMQYIRNHYAALTLFLRVPGAPVDNNVLERLIKLVVRGRRNSLFYRSETGAGVSDVITSVLATCRENEVNGFDYLVTLQRHQDAVRRSPESWLPWNYEAAVAELGDIEGEHAAAA